MKQTIDISSGNATKFNAGQSGKYLILRQASQSVILKGDNLRPVELERGDVVDVSDFDELEIYNHNSTSVHIEFQVSDVEVRIRTSQTSINGALNINEIQSPVVISRIQEPIDVQVNIPEVEVNIPDVAVTMPDELTIGNFPDELTIGNLPAVQQVQTKPVRIVALAPINLTASSTTKSIAAKSSRQGVLIQANHSNNNDLIIAGFYRLRPDGEVFFATNSDLSVSGHGGDGCTVGEFL